MQPYLNGVQDRRRLREDPRGLSPVAGQQAREDSDGQQSFLFSSNPRIHEPDRLRRHGSEAWFCPSLPAVTDNAGEGPARQDAIKWGSSPDLPLTDDHWRALTGGLRK